MDTQANLQSKSKRGAEDSGKYFKYMADFIGLNQDDINAIKRSAPIIEKHLPEIVAKFYSHLLRYPPTRKFFLNKNGSINQDYVELRMRHLTNFWLRTAGGVYDEEYARYVDYVGRAHTAHGADPGIYIAERYVIGQVGFIQHAIADALTRELRHRDEAFETQAIEAWDKLMMVILEMLSRAYGSEREQETFDALVAVDQAAVEHLAEHAFEHEHEKGKAVEMREIVVGSVDEVPDGERKIIQIGAASIGILHHDGKWMAMRNSCLHRGGPVLTGCIEGNVITCPWHGFQYDVMTGELLVDPSAKLDTFPVEIKAGKISVQIPASEAPLSQNLPQMERETKRGLDSI